MIAHPFIKKGGRPNSSMPERTIPDIKHKKNLSVIPFTPKKTRRTQSTERTPTKESLNKTYSSLNLSRVPASPLSAVPHLRRARSPSVGNATQYKGSLIGHNKNYTPEIKVELPRISRMKAFKSRIPVLQRDETVLTIANVLLAEQMRMLVQSIGFVCTTTVDYNNNTVLTIFGDITKPPTISKKLLSDFTIEDRGMSECIDISLGGDGTKYILANGIVIYDM
jgi:hypothetical protein